MTPRELEELRTRITRGAIRVAYESGIDGLLALQQGIARARLFGRDIIELDPLDERRLRWEVADMFARDVARLDHAELVEFCAGVARLLGETAPGSETVH